MGKPTQNRSPNAGPLHPADQNRILKNAVGNRSTTTKTIVQQVTPSATSANVGTTPPLVMAGNVLSMPQATAAQSGYLLAADWTTFNAKMTNPMTTAGDLIYGGAAGLPTRLPIGPNTYVVTSNGTTLSWQPGAGAGSYDTLAPVVWIAADAITGYTTGSPLTTFNDTAVRASYGAIAAPTYNTGVQNSLPGILAATSKMIGSGAPFGTPLTMIFVIKPTLGGAANMSLFASTVTGGVNFQVLTTGVIQLVSSFVANIGNSSSSVTTATPVVVSCTYDGLNYAFYINNTAAGAGVNSVIFTPGFPALFYNPRGGAEDYAGYLFEAKIWARVLGNTELGTEITALRTKWAI